jgi:hypothetical protein
MGKHTRQGHERLMDQVPRKRANSLLKNPVFLVLGSEFLVIAAL